MIVRILGEGQYDVADAEMPSLNACDDAVQKAIEADDDAAFRAALTELVARVREVGTRLPDDALEPSDLILPAADAHVDEVRAMLTDEGLIPG